MLDESDVHRYDNVNAYWQVGPTDYNDALLPQQFDYQVTLYDWLETMSRSDVTLQPGTFSTVTYAGLSKMNLPTCGLR